MAASITVAVGAIVTDGEHILLIRRGHNPGKGYWSVPGGRVEVGETLPAAVRREIREECCLDVAVSDVAILLDRVSRAEDGEILSHYLIVDFWATASGREVRAATDAEDIGWFTLDELRQLPTTTKLAAYLEEALRRRREGVPGCLVVSD